MDAWNEPSVGVSALSYRLTGALARGDGQVFGHPFTLRAFAAISYRFLR
jgi:hypothetical protein